jgi:predicted membrane protein (TIGR00267 family)
MLKDEDLTSLIVGMNLGMAKHTNFKLYIGKLHQVLNNFIQNNSTTAIFDEIARRAFVNNAFDGALTLLGILMGNIILGELHPKTVISTGFSACLAMGMSGAFGRYFSERAERKRVLRQMESYMFTDLSGSILEQDSKKKVILISLVDGLSPALAAAVPLIPFLLAQAMILPVGASIIASFTLDFLVLFILGVFLGRISGENTLLHGALMVVVGFITACVIFLSSVFS